MKTLIAYKDSALEKLIEGVNAMADIVKMTLGPRSRAVAIAKTDYKGNIYERKVIDDGVEVAKAIDLKNELSNMGAQLLKEAAQKQVDIVGDGTTVVTILAQAIIKEAAKYIAKGVNPMEIRLELEKDLQIILSFLKKYSIPLKTLDQKIQVAVISAKDEELGKIIAETLDMVGMDGIVTIEESKSYETVVEHQQGMQIDAGYSSPYFLTDPLTMSSVMENPYVLVTDIPITDFRDLIPFLTEFAKSGDSLTVFASEISDLSLGSFIQNKVEGKLMSLCVRSNQFAIVQNGLLSDIAVLTGATFFSKEAGFSLKNLTKEDLGRAKKIVATKDATIISEGLGNKEGIEGRIASLKKQLEEEEGFKHEKLKERLGKLSNGIAVIKVGGQTEVEMKERRERALDAVSATRSAIQGGITAGGEVIYLKLRNHSKSEILRYALKQPFYTLLENAGIDRAEIEFNVLDPQENKGIDVTDAKVKDMIQAGIIDPTQVAEQALKNAVSVAVQILTTGGIIVPEKEK